MEKQISFFSKGVNQQYIENFQLVFNQLPKSFEKTDTGGTYWNNAFPYKKTSEIKILIRKLSLPTITPEETLDAGFDEFIDNLVSFIKLVFKRDINLSMGTYNGAFSIAEEPENLCPSLEYTEEHLDFDKYLTKLQPYFLWDQLWRDEAEDKPCDEGDTFQFVITDLPIQNYENKHGILFGDLIIDGDSIAFYPGRHAILSLHPSISSPKFLDSTKSINYLIEKKDFQLYNYFRIAIFLIRNLIRSFGGKSFGQLHLKAESGKNNCLMYNPKNSVRDTQNWLINRLSIKLCPDCYQSLEKSKIKNNIDQKFIDSIQTACSELYGIQVLLKEIFNHE